MSINPARLSTRELRISILRKEPANAVALEADAPDWKKLPDEGYKGLPPLRKTSHGVEVDRAATEEGRYKAYSQEELDQRELMVSEGSLRVGNNQLPQDVLKLGYVMFPDGRIYVSNMQIGSIYHSSLCVGKEPVAAGMMKIVRGKILEINEESGHYAPNGQAGHVLKRLFDLGLKELDNCVVKVSRYSPIPNEQRSPLDMRADRLKEILSAKNESHSPDSKSASSSPATQAGAKRLKEKILTPRQLSAQTNSPPGPLPSTQNPVGGSEIKPEAGPLARFKASIFLYPKKD